MRKIKGLRWYMIALVTLGTVLGYLTRNTVAAAAPTLMEELHISTQQYSYIIKQQQYFVVLQILQCVFTPFLICTLQNRSELDRSKELFPFYL